MSFQALGVIAKLKRGHKERKKHSVQKKLSSGSRKIRYYTVQVEKYVEGFWNIKILKSKFPFKVLQKVWCSMPRNVLTLIKKEKLKLFISSSETETRAKQTFSLQFPLLPSSQIEL